MNKYIECVNELMVNNPLYSIQSETKYDRTISERKYEQFGGASEEIDRPSGGFPPIYLCDIKTKKLIQEKEKTKREYKTHKTAISIKDIMSERRKRGKKSVP